MAERFLAGQNPTAFSFAERFGHITESIRTGQALDFMKPGETTLAREVGAFLSDPKLKQALDEIIAREPNAQRRSFRMASHISNELSYRLITQFQRRLTKGQPDRRVSVGDRGCCRWAPACCRTWSPSASRRRTARCSRMCRGASPGTVPQPLRNEKRAWFTDTLEDVNGVARTIRSMVQAAGHAGADLTVVTSRSKLSITDIPIMNFPPVGRVRDPRVRAAEAQLPAVPRTCSTTSSAGASPS